MFSCQSLSIAVLALAGLVSTSPADAQSVGHLFESKDHYTGPVAKKLAEFKESKELYAAALAFKGLEVLLHLP